MKIVFQDPTFSSQLLRTISQTYYGGADIGECLSTAYRIEQGNFESWYSEWLKTAQRVLVDLKDKISKTYLVDEVSTHESNTNKIEALSALEVLGFTKKQCEKVLDKILLEDSTISVENLIKRALKNL